jgi:hypothetical protein
MTNNVELYAMYKFQYKLTINSTCLTVYGCTTPEGAGWHDNYIPVHVSVDSPTGLFWLQSFNYWNGDIPAEDQSSTHTVLTMDGPKDITAVWKGPLLLPNTQSSSRR